MKRELSDARKPGTRPGTQLWLPPGSVNKLAIQPGDFSPHNKSRNAILNAFEAAIL